MIDVQTKPAPIETVTPIRPSEAIRLGCLTTARITGRLVDDDGQSACAVGAMLIGWNGSLRDNDAAMDAMDGTAWDQVDQRAAACPEPHPKGNPERVSCVRSMPVYMVMQHLNDLSGRHEWSRERIADWLESLGL